VSIIILTKFAQDIFWPLGGPLGVHSELWGLRGNAEGRKISCANFVKIIMLTYLNKI
jgi:hypothetical protein